MNMNEEMNLDFKEKIRKELNGIESKHDVLIEKLREAANDRSLGARLTMKTIPNCLKRIMAASTFISGCKEDLAAIKDKLGYNDFYKELSNKIAEESIDVIIDAVNNAQSALVQKPDPIILQGIVEYALPPMEMIGTYDMDDDHEAFYKAQLTRLQRMNEALNARTRQTPGEKATSTPDQKGTVQKEESEGCYIATMVYGDYDHPQVKVLRDFRDSYLAKREWGSQFIDYYYRHSPKWVESLRNHKAINAAIRIVLDGFVSLWRRHPNHK